MGTLDRTILLQLARDGPNFAWEFNCPEPGLNADLQRFKDGILEDIDEDELDIAWMYFYLIVDIREHFREFQVPLDEIDERFEKLGMLHYWKTLLEPRYIVVSENTAHPSTTGAQIDRFSGLLV